MPENRTVDALTVTRGPAAPAVVGVGLILALALQNAVPPFATDMYTPAFPKVVDDLGTTAGLVGLTLTAFFLGMGAGQLLGGPVSDQRGRRIPLIAGGLICTVGAIGCALAPSIALLIFFRFLQGFGGGVAAVVARAVVVDLARGDQLARVLSVLAALGGLAPMIAPVFGGGVLTLGGTWRTVFWCLVGFGVLMTLAAAVVIPESLPPAGRRGGGLRTFAAGLQTVLRLPSFIGYALTAALSGFTMMAYIANAAYVLEDIKGVRPLPYSLFFASAALANVLLSLVNARLVGRVSPNQLIGVGLSLAGTAVVVLAISVFALGIPLILTCAGFLVLMGAQAFVFGNAAALASGQATEVAGAASAVIGVVQAVAMAVAAPVASSGGASSANPMVWAMIGGIVAAGFCFLVLAQRGSAASSRAS